jgi:outer membrane protein assembly factor BamB
MTFKLLASIVVVVALLGAAAVGQDQSADLTQWRGQNRDGVVGSFTEPKAWPDQLTQRWKVEVGEGYATPLLVGSRIYMFSRQGPNETMRALDADSGKVLWQTGYPASFTMQKAAARHGPGPKSTPVFSNGRIFSIGMTGIVTAFDAASGRQIWQKPGSEPLPMYTTHAFSPVVVGNVVVFHVGGHMQGALTGFDVNTGDVRWSWPGDGPGYGSPVVTTIDGVRQVVTITQGKIVGVDAATGALLWERPYVSPNFTNSMTPFVAGQLIIVSGPGPTLAFTAARRNNQWATENIWENAEVPMRMTNPVVAGDVLLGLANRNMGQYFALDVKTGKTLWTTEGRQAGNASILRSGNTVFILEDDGELVIVRSSATAFEPLKRYKVAESETWTQPTISGNRIFVKDVTTLTLWTIS